MSYRAEIAKMLRTMPSAWKAQYRLGRRTLTKNGGPTLPESDPTPEQVMELLANTAGGHSDIDTARGDQKVPSDVRDAAMHGLRLSYANNYGGWEFFGIARAIQLATVPAIPMRSRQRMNRYLSDHRKDQAAPNFGNDKNPSAGYMAWLNWGGDPAYEWVSAVPRASYSHKTRLNSATARRKNALALAVPSVRRNGDEDDGYYVEDDDYAYGEAPLEVNTNTPAFRRWFGDSKVTQYNGEPQMVYHGSPRSGFSKFRPRQVHYFTDDSSTAATYMGGSEASKGRGTLPYLWIEPSKKTKPGIYAVYLKIERPLVVDAKGHDYADIPYDSVDFDPKVVTRVLGTKKRTSWETDEISAVARRLGYDGVIFRRIRDEGGDVEDEAYGALGTSTVYAAFTPTQIKSVFGSRGTFAPNDPDIRHNPVTARRTRTVLRTSTKRGLLRNPATSLPASFSPHDPALLTAAEFIDLRNPGGKRHTSDAYDFALDSPALNPGLSVYAQRDDYGTGSKAPWILLKGLGDDDYAVERETARGRKKYVAVVQEGTLYYLHGGDVPVDNYRVSRDHYFNLPVTRKQSVKYLDSYLSRVLDVQAFNRQKYPLVLRRFSLRGEPFELRADRTPRKNKRDTLVVVNRDGYVVSKGADEWGATLLVTAREYRGWGLGKVLADVWYDYNPASVSGGFTYAGEANALATWAKRVREFMAKGWYSELVRQGVLSAARVRSIIAGLPVKRSVGSDLPALPAKAQEMYPPLVYVDEDNVSFIIYDPRFLAEQDEKYIYAYGFFRGDGKRVFLYRIEYTPAYRDMATRIALQLARENKDKIYVGGLPGDLVEWEGIAGAKRTGDFVSTTRDVFPALARSKTTERQIRRKFDRYDEIKYRLQEMADSKWD